MLALLALLLLAIIGFIASAIAHASTFSDPLPTWLGRAWPLHLGLVMVFVADLIQKRRVKRGKGQFFLDRHPRLGNWAGALVLACGINCFFNFALFLAVADWGGRREKSDVAAQVVLVERSEEARQSAELQRRRQDAWGWRGMTSLWMFFYCCGAVIVGAGPWGAQRDTSAPPGQSGEAMPSTGDAPLPSR